MYRQFKEAIASATKLAYPDIKITAFDLIHPDKENFGDYATNVALIVASHIKENPMDVAEKIITKMPRLSFVEKTEIARPGYINFHLTQSFLESLVPNILIEESHYGTKDDANGRRMLIEYGTPNTHKLPHIGHLFNFIYGESIARLQEMVGAKVHRVNYQGDVGLHVAKCLWAYQAKPLTNPDAIPLGERIDYLQVCYQEGARAYDEDPKAKSLIDSLNQKIYAKEPEITQVWEETRQWCLDYYKMFESRLGIHYNTHYFESDTSQKGEEIVKSQVGKIFESHDGAIIFRGEQYGLHTRVFINRMGNPTYETKDVGLMAKKLQDWNFDCSIVMTANEQNDYWRVMFKVFELLFPQSKGKLFHIGYGMINLTEGKMSSRTGEIISAFGLVEHVKKRIRERIDAERDYNEGEKETIAESLALGAIKYSFLKSNPRKDSLFDMETSIAHEGNSGPYLQYTYARCRSVLRKADFTGEVDHYIATNADEFAILRWLARYRDTVSTAAEQFAPQVIAAFLYELAQRYSYFYNEHQIMGDDEATTQSRLALTAAVAQVLKNGLHLLGIEAPEKV